MAGRDITIKFNPDESAMHFAQWLCGSGEQQYWEWMRCREDEEDGPITALEFNYFPTWNEDDDHEFMEDWTIRTKCGRLEED